MKLVGFRFVRAYRWILLSSLFAVAAHENTALAKQLFAEASGHDAV